MTYIHKALSNYYNQIHLVKLFKSFTQIHSIVVKSNLKDIQNICKIKSDVNFSIFAKCYKKYTFILSLKTNLTLKFNLNLHIVNRYPTNTIISL